MRGLAVLLAVAAAWLLAGAPAPQVRISAPRLPEVDLRAFVMSIASGAAAAFLALGVTAAPAIAGAVGALAASAPLAAASARRARQRADLAGRWPDLLAIVRSHLAGGAALPEAFVAAARRSGPVLAEAGDEVAGAIARSGDTFPAALGRLQTRLADPIADRILTTLAEAHRAGGHQVAAVLAALGTSVADELRLRRAHDAALTQQRLTAAVALVAPWGLLVLTVTTNPQAAIAYRTSTGASIIGAGLVATLGGYLIARRVARLSRPPRVFG